MRVLWPCNPSRVSIAFADTLFGARWWQQMVFIWHWYICEDRAVLRYPITQIRFMHYVNVIMTTVASQITSLAVVYSIVYSGVDERKHQSSASLAFVRGITGTGEFPAQRASYPENVSIWWRHHGLLSDNKHLAVADKTEVCYKRSHWYPSIIVTLMGQTRVIHHDWNTEIGWRTYK